MAAIKPLQRRAMLAFAFAVIGFLSPATFLTGSHPVVPRLGIRRTTPLPPMRMAPCICNGGRIGGRRIGGRSGLRKPLVAEATRDDDDDNDQVSRSSHSWHSPRTLPEPTTSPSPPRRPRFYLLCFLPCCRRAWPPAPIHLESYSLILHHKKSN